jgi:hypothetical protein
MHGKKRSEKNHGSKNATTIKTRQGIFVLSTPGKFFSEIKIVTGYILVIFASMQLQILLISIRSTDEQFCRMGSLAWLGYLSYTQVVESSNLSPSIIYRSASFLEMHSRDVPENSVSHSKHEERDARLIIDLACYYPLAGKPFHYSSNTLSRLVQ